jgi:hypothetical protein
MKEEKHIREICDRALYVTDDKISEGIDLEVSILEQSVTNYEDFCD